MALICILLITSEVEHHFIILLPNIVFCSVKCLLFCLFSQVFEEFLYVFIYSGPQLLIKNALQSFLTMRACLVVSHGFLWWVKPLSFNVVRFINSSAASTFSSFLWYCSPQFLRDDISCLLPNHLSIFFFQISCKEPRITLAVSTGVTGNSRQKLGVLSGSVLSAFSEVVCTEIEVFSQSYLLSVTAQFQCWICCIYDQKIEDVLFTEQRIHTQRGSFIYSDVNLQLYDTCLLRQVGWFSVVLWCTDQGRWGLIIPFNISAVHWVFRCSLYWRAGAGGGYCSVGHMFL